METMAQFVGCMFQSRTQAHIYHLRTKSYAEHKALNDYYDGIVGLADDLAEAYQGKYGLLKGYGPFEKIIEDGTPIAYFEDLAKYIDKCRKGLPQDSYLQNIIDEIVALVSSTVYKLKFLS